MNLDESFLPFRLFSFFPLKRVTEMFHQGQLEPMRSQRCVRSGVKSFPAVDVLKPDERTDKQVFETRQVS